jgi:hypothetical protein
VGVSGISGFSIAKPIGPEDPKHDVKHQTRDLGSSVYYDKRDLDAGSRVKFLDSAWIAGKWNYVYRTSASSGAVDYKTDSNEKMEASVLTGGEGFTIKELDNPQQVSTSVAGNSDWGIGVKTPYNHGYNWSDATVDSIKSIISYFNSSVGAITTAADIVDYWKKAAKPSESNSDVVGNYWNFWDSSGPRTASLGHYAEFRHVVPPRESYGKDYFDSTVRNSQNNNANQFDNYTQTFGLSSYVNSSPSSMSTSEKKKYSIEKVPAAESRAAMVSSEDLDPNESVYVAKSPTIKIEKL